jgi:sugar lactone lactonase YvrE
MPRRPELVLDGLGFGEGPRWHDGRLWYSDFLRQLVASVGTTGDQRVELELDDRPSGLGWMPDGDLLVVSMRRRAVLRRSPDGRLSTHGDISAIATSDANDMVVAADGTAYVGNFGSDLLAGEPHRDADLAMVRPDESVAVAARGLRFPNGSVITPDGSTLIVGESLGRCYTAFRIGDDGALDGRRVWAELGERSPDGCTLDADGAIWFADAGRGPVVHVREGGEILEEVDVADRAYACALGGEDGRTLYVLTSSVVPRAGAEPGGGRLWAVRVDVPHAGLP